MSTTDRHTISSVHDLHALVGEPLERVRTKEMPALDERAVAFIATAPFLVLATSGADGSSDASPKGGPPGFVRSSTSSGSCCPISRATAASTAGRTWSSGRASAFSS